MFAYPEGGARRRSAVTFLCFAAAVVVLWRRGRGTVAALCLAPFGLALVAAAIHRYPYGVSARTTQYAAPAICLLTGLGAAYGLVAGQRPGRPAAAGSSASRAAWPCSGSAGSGSTCTTRTRRRPTSGSASFARWFWTEQSRDGVVVCARRDLGADVRPPPLDPGRDRHVSLLPEDLLPPRTGSARPADLDSVSADPAAPGRPLQRVPRGHARRSTPGWPGCSPATTSTGACTYPVSSVERKIGPTWDQVYVVYEFVPEGAVLRENRDSSADDAEVADETIRRDR